MTDDLNVDKVMRFWLCNGKAPCRQSYGCSYRTHAPEDCMHISSPEYALNPRIFDGAIDKSAVEIKLIRPGEGIKGPIILSLVELPTRHN